FAIDVLHRDVGRAFDLAEVVHSANVGMRDLAGGAHLAVEAFEQAGMVRRRRGQELQRDGLVELEIDGSVDLAHAAAAEESEYAVALAESGSGGEEGFIRRRARRGRRLAPGRGNGFRGRGAIERRRADWTNAPAVVNLACALRANATAGNCHEDVFRMISVVQVPSLMPILPRTSLSKFISLLSKTAENSPFWVR